MNQVLEKISKALALGTNNTNENEAQAAILAAQRLMAKHKINQEDVDSFIKVNEENEPILEENVKKNMQSPRWQRTLFSVIANNFRCDTFYRYKSLTIVGEKEDIEIVKKIYQYATNTINKSFRKYYSENYEGDNSHRNRCKRDYALGFVRGLSEKLKEQKEINTEIEWGLVVVNPNVEKYMDNLNLSKGRKPRRAYYNSSEFYDTGLDTGRNLPDIDTSIAN